MTKSKKTKKVVIEAEQDTSGNWLSRRVNKEEEDEEYFIEIYDDKIPVFDFIPKLNSFKGLRITIVLEKGKRRKNI